MARIVKLQRMMLTVTAVCGLWVCSGRAADTVVYVSPTNEPTWDLFTPTGNGSVADPYATIQEAYYAVWFQTGHHQIRLLPGTFEYGHIGVRPENTAYTGHLRFHAGPFMTPALWDSVTLMADQGTGTVEIVYHYPLGGEFPSTVQPAAYEVKIIFGGQNLQGLFNPNAAYPLPDMRVQDVTIRIEGGGLLIGRDWDVAIDDYTFTNVELYLESDRDVDPLLPGSPFGNSAIHWHDWTGVQNSKIRFVDSNIYYDPGLQNALFAGQTWNAADMPADLIDGTGSSRIYYWDGADWVLKTNLTEGIWESKRNVVPGEGSAGLKWNENGSNPNGFTFLSNFLNVPPDLPPPPSGYVLIVR